MRSDGSTASCLNCCKKKTAGRTRDIVRPAVLSCA